jgi:hypothetical protein
MCRRKMWCALARHNAATYAAERVAGRAGTRVGAGGAHRSGRSSGVELFDFDHAIPKVVLHDNMKGELWRRCDHS